VNVIAIQLDIVWENKAANFAKVRRLLTEARPEKGTLVVLPEMFATGFSMNAESIAFQSEEERLAGWMLGSADLLGQMADRTYLEKLLFLYREFREGNIPGFGSERDLLVKTLGFYETTRRKLENDFGNVQEYLLAHFSARWNLDHDVYRDSIQRNVEYLEGMILNSGDHYRDHLRRGGLVQKLQQEND
jgi:hypothetical protein